MQREKKMSRYKMEKWLCVQMSEKVSLFPNKELNTGALQWKQSLNHWIAREIPKLLFLKEKNDLVNF